MCIDCDTLAILSDSFQEENVLNAIKKKGGGEAGSESKGSI